jgi:hypothetical protein
VTRRLDASTALPEHFYEALVSDGVPGKTDPRPPNGGEIASPPISPT